MKAGWGEIIAILVGAMFAFGIGYGAGKESDPGQTPASCLEALDVTEQVFTDVVIPATELLRVAVDAASYSDYDRIAQINDELWTLGAQGQPLADRYDNAANRCRNE
jgi:hypothetical protein